MKPMTQNPNNLRDLMMEQFLAMIATNMWTYLWNNIGVKINETQKALK
jgi:hypothetical protein